MQLVTQILGNFAKRVPSIRFPGSDRHSPVQTPIPTPPAAQGSPAVAAKSHPVHKVGALKAGPAVRNVGLFVTRLEEWQIDVINAGGFIDAKAKKVKPIALKK
jgi:hypothetical protein